MTSVQWCTSLYRQVLFHARTTIKTNVSINKRRLNYVSCIPFGHFANQPALTDLSGSIWKYSELSQKIDHLSYYLSKHEKVHKGDRVAARTFKSRESLALYLALLNLGAIYVPVSLDYTEREVFHVLHDSQARLLIDDKLNEDAASPEIQNLTAYLPHLRRLNFNQVWESAIKGGVSWDLTESVDQDDIAVICYTSGTTGSPKGAMMTHGNISSNGSALMNHWQFSSNDVVLHFLPLNHVHGLMVAISPTLFSGASMTILPKFDPRTVLEQLPNCSVVMGVPTHYNRLISTRSSNDLREIAAHMRLFTCGSAPLTPALWEKVAETLGQPVLERYGMTEAQMICSNPYEPERRKPGHVGQALPGITIRVQDGILQCKGPNVFRGYWNAEEKTRKTFTEDGFLITGDHATLDDEGYVQILGRDSDMIISGGMNIYPKEIETELDQITEIKESAVFGAAHPDFGEAVVAAVVLEDFPNENRSINQEEVIKLLRSRLAGYKVPKEIVVIPELPRNTMGKVLKKDLKHEFGKLFCYM